MQAIERQETEITPKEVLYEIFYDGHKRRVAIQGLRKKGLRRFWNMRLRTMTQEYIPTNQ